MAIKLRSQVLKWMKIEECPRLQKSVIELNNVAELKKLFFWDKDAVLEDPAIHEYSSIEDLNERRIRDAESIGTVCKNVGSGTFLEVGTSYGNGTALMAQNAPQATIHTVNMPPEESDKGDCGKYITHDLQNQEIGKYYRKLSLQNIKQIFANTATWTPDIGDIDVAFIDGCHDTDFVFNDSRKALKNMKPGSFILWHDFNLELYKKRGWIRSVCLGVEKLYTEGLIKGKTYHIRDSWVGIHRVE